MATHQVLTYENGVNLIGDNIRVIERNAVSLLNACKDISLAVNTGKTKYIEVGCHGDMMVKEHITYVIIRMKMWNTSNI